MSYLKGFALAWNMLTVFPFFAIHRFENNINGKSAMFYPLVGLLMGYALFLTHTLLSPYFPPLHLGAIIFALMVLFSGALHLDGFVDVVDGLFVAKKRALEVMKDSRIGGMGMIFGGVFLLLKLSSLLAVENYTLLGVVMMLSRFNAVVAIFFFPYISKGVGALIKEELHFLHLVIGFGLCFAWCVFFEQVWLLPLSLAFVFVIAYAFTKRYGGLNGDIYGFIIETTELFLLNAIIIAQ